MGTAYRVAVTQIVTVSSGSLAIFIFLGLASAVAALFGGLVAVVNLLFLIWRMHVSAQKPPQSAQQELAGLVQFSMKRFLLVTLLIVAGLGWFKLTPIPLLAGFVLGQLTLVVSTIFSRE